jgi:predicted ester cyclase
VQALKCFADPQRRSEYFDYYSDDIIVHGYQGIGPGLNSVKQLYYAFWRVFPDAQVIAHDLIGEGDTLVARNTITGTMHEDFMGVAATGQRIELPGVSVLHFRNQHANHWGRHPLLCAKPQACIRNPSACLSSKFGRNSDANCPRN